MLAVILSDSAHFGKDFKKLCSSVEVAESYLRKSHKCDDDLCWRNGENGERFYYCDDWGYIIIPSEVYNENN